MTLPLDSRPLIIALAGPNGAGKSTFFQAHLQPAGLRFINADDLARELGTGAYEAAELANQLRRTLVEQRGIPILYPRRSLTPSPLQRIS